MKAKLTTVVALLLVGAMCAFAEETSIQGASISKYEATQISNNGNFFIVPLTADLKVLTNTMQEYKLVETIELPPIQKKEKEADYLIRLESYLNKVLLELKSRALYEFIDKTNSSLIVSPLYSTKTLSSKGNTMRIELRVKGYPATYTNFRNITAADSTIVKLNNSIKQKDLDVISIDKKHIDPNERVEEIHR